MATGRFYRCTSCDQQTPIVALFSALKAWASAKGPPACMVCGAAQNLYLEFPFAFSPPVSMQVLQVFRPTEGDAAARWNDSTEREVAFHPFLVIAERRDPNQAASRTAWLPYWHTMHVAGKTTTKYGQWAPNMNIGLFDELITQAREEGYLG
jgi:hypothetical protein